MAVGKGRLRYSALGAGNHERGDSIHKRNAKGDSEIGKGAGPERKGKGGFRGKTWKIKTFGYSNIRGRGAKPWELGEGGNNYKS